MHHSVSASSGDNHTSIATKFSVCIVFLVAAVIFAVQIGDWVAAIQRQYSISYEGPILWTALQLSHGQNIYPMSGLIHIPFFVNIYPPLYFAVGAVLVKMFGATYIPLRMISMLSAVLLSVSLYRILRLYQCSKTACALVLAFLFSLDPVCGQAHLARTDMLACALAVFMLERFCTISRNNPQEDSLLKYWPVTVLECLALLAKQQAIVFVLALHLYTFVNGPKKLAVKLLVAFVAVFGSTVGVLQLVTQGGFLAHLSFLAPVKPQLDILLLNLYSAPWSLIKILLAGGLLCFGILKKWTKDSDIRLPGILFAVSVCFMSYTMGIPASDINHIICATIALAWIFGVMLTHVPVRFYFAFAVIPLIGIQSLTEFGRLAGQLTPFADKSAEVLKAQKLDGQLVLADDTYVNLLTNSQPAMIDCATFMNVWHATNQRDPLESAIKSKQFAAVIIDSHDVTEHDKKWWPQQMIDAVTQNYRHVDQIHCSGWFTELYEPNRNSVH